MVFPLTGAGSQLPVEIAENRPADLTLGRRGPEDHDEVSAVSGGETGHTQQQQSEFTEVSPAQASLGTALPLAGSQPAGVV